MYSIQNSRDFKMVNNISFFVSATRPPLPCEGIATVGGEQCVINIQWQKPPINEVGDSEFLGTHTYIPTSVARLVGSYVRRSDRGDEPESLDQ